MLITVTTTSQNFLTEIASPEQKTQMNESRDSSVRDCIIQNLGANDIYVEFSSVAKATDGLKIVPNATFNFTEMNLEDLNLISAGSDNEDVRILVN